jgi:hypothetical protein
MPPMIEPAIDRLRKYQKIYRQRLGFSPSHTEEEILALALKHAIEREEKAIPKDDFIHEGVFKYPAGIEELRWQRTREIIRRVVPGTDENPIYLEMLARQAASLEIALCKQHTGSPNPKALAVCDCILIGTIADLQPNAFEVCAGDDHFAVLLSYGLISFLYQAAKAIVLSWKPLKARSGSSVSFSWKTEDINGVIAKDPYPLELLY